MDAKAPKELSYFNQHHLLILNILLISVMLTCFAVILERIIISIYPMWGMTWYPVVTFLLSTLSLFTRQAHRKTPRVFLNQTRFILTEIILIILITKAISMLFLFASGYLSLWQEVASWSQNFMENFFNLDFIIRSSAIFLIWLLTWLFSAPLNKLEEDHALMEQEKMGYTFTDRYDARRKLIHLIFNIGILMIILLVIWKSNLSWFDHVTASTGSIVTVLLAYFITAFLFLALNQYAIMKARWFFNEIVVNPELPKRWLFYSLFFIFSVMLVIVFLPTNIPLGISSIADWLSGVILYLSSILFSIITFPIFFILALISSLMGRGTVGESFQAFEPQRDSLPHTIAETPWLDIVQSILFWLVFVGIIFITITFYIKNKPNLNQFVRDLRLFALFKEFWQWIRQGFVQAKNTSSETIQKGLEKIQTFLKIQKQKLPSLIDFAKKLPPRQAVIFIYTDWINWNRQHGLIRKKSQTPNEYAQAFLIQYGEAIEQVEKINALTKVFILARYSHHPIIKEQALQAQQLVKQLKKIIVLQDDQTFLKESQS